MDREETRELTRDVDLDEVIAAYLKAVETGAAQNPRSLIAQYPAFAKELSDFFADQQGFQRLAEPIRAAVAGAPPLGTEIRYFGDYELLEEIARGGMGVVYLARQVSLNRLVALKMILAGTLASSAAVQRFRNEAEAAANLEHPNIVPIYEVGEHEGQQYFSMGLVDGGSLADRLGKSGPLPPRAAAELVKLLAEAIAFAHERGVIHRDLKPSNVLLDAQGKPKISDFGLAKRIQKTDGPTMTGDVLGTPGYMPPEQAAGTVDLVGTPADVYSLGAILYACLTGRPPFQAASPLQTLRLVLTDEPVLPSNVKSSTPRDLETICLKCLEKNPQRRYTSASELAEDLGRFLADEPVHARPAGRLRRSVVWLKKRPWVVSGIIALGLLLVACGAYGLWAEIRERGWKIEFLQARVARLSSPPQTGVALAHLQRAARIRADDRLLQEAMSLFVADAGFKLAYPRDPGERNQQPLFDATKRARHAVPMIWDRAGRRLYLKGMELDTESGRSSPLLVAGAGPAMADPTGSYLAAVDAKGKIVLVDRASGRRRSIDRCVDGFESLRFAPDGRSLAVLSRSEKPGGKPQLELWKTTENGPPVRLTGSITGHCLMSFSGDGRRFAWWCSGQPSIVVARTEDGSLVAEPSVPPGEPSPWEMALNPNGAHVAWSYSGWIVSGNSTIRSVVVEDVATGAIIGRLPGTTLMGFVEDLAYSPDDRFLFGRVWGEAPPQSDWLSLIDRRSSSRAGIDEILMWDLTSGELVLRLSGKAFARGLGANGELAVLRQTTPDADDLRVELVRPADLAARIAAAGLRPSTGDAQVFRVLRLPLQNLMFGWPTLFGFIAYLIVYLSSLERLRRGQAMPPNLARVTAAIGVIAVAWAIARTLGVLDLPDWSAGELGFAIWCSLIPVTLGTAAISDSVRNLSSAYHGDNVPVLWPTARKEDIKGIGLWALRRLVAAWAAWLIFMVTAALDGSVSRFGLLGILLFEGLPSGLLIVVLVIMALVSLRLQAEKRTTRSRVPGMNRLRGWLAQPRVTLAVWTCGAVIAAIYGLIGVWDRVVHRAWERFPPLRWGEMEFRMLYRRETLGSAAFAAAVVFLAVAVTKARRIARTAKAKRTGLALASASPVDQD